MNKVNSIGTNNLVEGFGKVTLSAELKSFLALLEAKLVLVYSPGSEAPEFRIQDDTGKMVCSVAELVKLGGFRRFTNEMLKAIDKDSHVSERISLVAQFLTKFGLVSEVSPGRMEESNEAKFKQFYLMSKVVDENLKKIGNCADNTYREYLLEKGRHLEGVIFEIMVECFKAEKLPKNEYKMKLFANYIPKWVAGKLVDSQFTVNLTHDVTSLLFPRGNYYKSVSLTTEEISDEDFLMANRDIVINSVSIIELAKKDWSILFPPKPQGLEVEVEAIYNEFGWTLISPATTQEVLDFRCTGKQAPVFKTRNASVQKNRKESDVEAFKRALYNKLGLLIATWLDFFNLIIPMENPPRNFWAKIAPAVAGWTFTPGYNLYHQLKDNGTKIGSVRDLSNEAVLSLMGEICIQKLGIPINSTMGKEFLEFFKDLKDKEIFKLAKPEEMPTLPGVLFTKEDIFENEIPNSKKELAKTYLGLAVLNQKKFKKSQSASKMIGKEALRELELIKDHAIYESVKEWITTSFITGKYHTVQKIAAQMVAGEVFKNKNKILGDEFDEFKYIENFDNDDEE